MDKNPITPEGAAKLRDELHHLKAVERPAIIQAIATAREHGDLSENAEYHAARERQSFIEGRVKEIEDKLARAEVIDPAKLAGDRVAFGATVKLSNVDSGEEVSYRILGADEADLGKGTISITSPLARSLIGKQVGDEVKMRMPGGERTYEVLDITFG
jgi:transcription elongation factor GreA